MYRTSPRSSISFVAFSLFWAGSFVAQAGPVFSVQVLGALGSQASGLNGLNSSGVAAGYYTDAAGYQDPASFNGSRTQVGSNGIASGINDSGVIVGTSYSGAAASVTEWSGSGQTSLGFAGYGMGVNNSGEVVGTYQASATQSHAFTYLGGKLIDLGTLGGSWSSANAVNNSGQVAGTSSLANGNFAAFGYSSGSLQNLGTLGGKNSYGLAINGQGQIAGTAQTASGYLNAFLWTGGGMVDVGTLGGTSSAAYGVNDAGWIVGQSTTTNNISSDGFLYVGGSMWDLNNLLPAGCGWDVLSATAVNDAGDILAIAQGQGQDWAVELTPTQAISGTQAQVVTPEPTTLMLSGLGIFFLLRRRRRLTSR